MRVSESSTAFVTLWSAHGPRVYSYIYSLVANWSDADDVFQETSLVLLEKFHEFQPDSNFLAWACKVAHFKALQCLQARSRMNVLDEQLLQAIGERQSQLLEHADARLSALNKCLKKLVAQDRQLIKLRYNEDGEVATIAAQVGRSPNVVYKSLRRIHETLFNCIRQRLSKGGDP